MTTYYNITATVAFDQIEADSPQEAAAKAYAIIAAQQAQPERILVWDEQANPNGGVTFKSTAWTYAEAPQEIVFKRPAPAKPVEQTVEVPVEAVEAPAPLSLA